MLQIKKLNLTHKKDLRVIIDDFNLVLNNDDKAVIIGEEGNGKSTLLKWIYNPSLIENYIEAEGEKIIGNERFGYSFSIVIRKWAVFQAVKKLRLKSCGF